MLLTRTPPHCSYGCSIKQCCEEGDAVLGGWPEERRSGVRGQEQGLQQAQQGGMEAHACQGSGEAGSGPGRRLVGAERDAVCWCVCMWGVGGCRCVGVQCEV